MVGFLRTGALGTTITPYYTGVREKQAQQRELAITLKASIAELSALSAEYLARAEMVLAAIERGDEGSAKGLEAMLDEAAVRWQTEMAPMVMAARDVLPKAGFVPFVALVRGRRYGSTEDLFRLQCAPDPNRGTESSRRMCSVAVGHTAKGVDVLTGQRLRSQY